MHEPSSRRRRAFDRLATGPGTVARAGDGSWRCMVIGLEVNDRHQAPAASISGRVQFATRSAITFRTASVSSRSRSMCSPARRYWTCRQSWRASTRPHSRGQARWRLVLLGERPVASATLPAESSPRRSASRMSNPVGSDRLRKKRARAYCAARRRHHLSTHASDTRIAAVALRRWQRTFGPPIDSTRATLASGTYPHSTTTRASGRRM